MIELMIVIAIMLILASIVAFASLNGAAEARDAKRAQELNQIAGALQVYHVSKGKYPDNTDTDDPDCDSHGVTWDAGNNALGADDIFLKPLIDERVIGVLPKEWTDIEDASGSACVYRYAKVLNPCDGKCPGTYAILFAACETNKCPINERPACCDGSTWEEGAGDNDAYDLIIFLKQKH